MSDLGLQRAKIILRDALERIEGVGFHVRAKGDPHHMLDLLSRDLVAFDDIRESEATE